jgi:hypothetical protein
LRFFNERVLLYLYRNNLLALINFMENNKVSVVSKMNIAVILGVCLILIIFFGSFLNKLPPNQKQLATVVTALSGCDLIPVGGICEIPIGIYNEQLVLHDGVNYILASGTIINYQGPGGAITDNGESVNAIVIGQGQITVSGEASGIEKTGDGNISITLNNITQDGGGAGIYVYASGGSFAYTGNLNCTTNQPYACVRTNGFGSDNISINGNITSIEYGMLSGGGTTSVTGNISAHSNSALHCSNGTCNYLGGRLTSDLLYGLEMSGGTMNVKNAIITSANIDGVGIYGDGDAVSKYGGEILTIENSTLIGTGPTVYGIGSQGITQCAICGVILNGTVYANREIQSTIPTSGNLTMIQDGPDTTAPTIPTLISPQNNFSTAVTPAFNWSAVPDPSWSVTYSFQLANNINFASPLISLTDIQANGFNTVNQLSSGNYYWRVQASDSSNNQSIWSEVRNFSITGTPTNIPVITISSPLQNSVFTKGSFTINTVATTPSGIDWIKISVNGNLKKTCNPSRSTPTSLNCSVNQSVSGLNSGLNTILVQTKDVIINTATATVSVIKN